MTPLTGVKNRQLVFLVGAPRSGTSWLQLCLGCSPHIATANETHLFSSYLQSLFHNWRAYRGNRRSIGLHHLVDEDTYFGEIRVFSDRILDRIGERKSGASVTLEKTPAHGRCWRDIVRLYPHARFVHLIRDPRAVVNSLRAAGRGWGADWAAPGIIENALLWRRDVASARAIGVAGHAYLEVQYEALLDDPAGQLANILGWLGLPDATKEACAFYVETVERGSGDGLAWDVKAEPAGFATKRGRDGWRKELRPWQVRAIERLTSPLAVELGYFDTPARGWVAQLVLYEAVERFDRWYGWQRKKWRQRL